MNIFLLFLSMFFMIGYYLIASPSQNLGYNDIQYDHQNSEMRSLIDCVVAKQNAFINNSTFDDECVKRYEINSTEICTDAQFELIRCDNDPYYDFIITASHKIEEYQYKDAFNIIDKTHQDFGTLGLFMAPNVIAANSVGKKLIPDPVIKIAELESGQIVYVIQNSIQIFDPNHPNSGNDENCRFSIIGKICDDPEIEVCTGNEVWDEELQKCVDHTDLCEKDKLLLIDESDNSYFCVDPTNKICAGNKTLQYNYKLQAWECVVVENSDDTECDLSQFSLRLHSSLDSAAPTARIRTINCNSCEKRVLDESTCTVYCSPDATKLNLGECYNDKLIPLNKCTGPNRGVYFGFAPGRTQYAVNILSEDDTFQNSDVILNVEKFLDKDHLQDRLYHCFECENGMSNRLSVSPFSAMCQDPDEENDENIVCDGKQIIALDPETGKYYCKEIEDDDDDDEEEEYHGSGIALSSYSGTTTYPTPVVFYVTENSTNGTLTVKTSDPKIATASISGSIVTVTPVARGKAYIYVRSSTRGSYEAGVARYTLHVNSAGIVVSAPDITFDYDGEEHNCANVRVRTPSTGAVVSYGATAGSYRGAPTITDPGSTTVYYRVTATNYEDLTGHYQCSVSGGQYGGVNLSTYSSTITYPQTSAYFTASCLSGGKFTVDNSDPDVATVKVGEEGEILVTYQTPGTTVITITCPEGRGYLESSATYTLTTQKGTIEATASPKSLTYNGAAQSCQNVYVNSPRRGASVTYSTSSSGPYSSTAPTLTDIGSIMVYYKITAANYNDKTGSYKCTMSKGGSSTITLSESSGTITYPETTTSFTATCNSGGALSVRSDNTKVATAAVSGGKVTVTYKSAGETTIHVICEQTSNYGESEAIYTITTEQGTLAPEVNDKYLTYSGSAQSCDNTFTLKDVPSFTVKYSLTAGGSYSTTAPTLKDIGSINVFYKITADNYDEFSGSYKCTMSSGTSSLELSSYSGTVQFPDTKTISVTKNISNGALTAQSNTPSVATVNIKGTDVIMTPVKTGTAKITVTSAATGNYSASTADYNLTVDKGTITANISNPTKIYDGSSLSCNGVSNVKPSNATVKYKTTKEGTYSATVPTVTNVSDSKTIYYQITATNYNNKEGSFSCSITSGGEAVITFSEPSGTIVYPNLTRTFTATCSSGGTLTVASSNTSVAEAVIKGNEVTVTYKTAGEANIIVTCEATGNYGQASKAYKITNQLGTITATVVNKSKTFDGKPLSCNGISNVTPTSAVVEYKKPDGSYSTTVPTVTNVSDSTTISYKITATNYTTKTGTFNCTIVKEEGGIVITPNNGELTYPGTATFNVMCTTGGTLSVTPENASIATATINQSTGNATVSYAGKGTTKINVKCAATGNADELNGFYTITTHSGVISAKAEDKVLQYTGSEQSCANVTVNSPSGTTTKYSTSQNGTYTTTPPKLTAANSSTPVYYKVSKTNYETASGNYTCSVSGGGTGTITLNPSSIDPLYPYSDPVNIDVTCGSGGTVSAVSSNTNIASVDYKNTKVTVNYVNAGSTTVTITCGEKNGYSAVSKTVNIVNKTGTILVNAPDITVPWDEKEQCSHVTVNRPSSGYTVQFSTSSTGTYASEYKITNLGKKTVYYSVSAPNYETLYGSFNCTVQPGEIKADAFDVEYQYDGTEHSCGIVNVKKPSSGVTVKYSLDNSTFDKDTIGIVTPGQKKIFYMITATFYNTKYGNYVCEVTTGSPSGDAAVDSCLNSGGTIVQGSSEAFVLCQIPTTASQGCPDGFTLKTRKMSGKTDYYCEQQITVR